MKVREIVKRFLTDERGLETVEYAIIAALITLAAIGIITTVGTSVAAKFQLLDDSLQPAPVVVGG